ncbi:MAG TPA: helix-turn-helix domain-containing protein [Lentisphaeria bacterium]|nr:helix-turn-helix domain-containing protein [Lentisphaeria bacterium]
MNFHRDWFYPPYASVAVQKQRNATAAKKLSAKGRTLKPVCVTGRMIATTFWGKAWCDNVESYQDYANRLPRGRSYVRYGAVLDLQIVVGKVTALVAGSASQPYQITIAIAPMDETRWEALKKKCVGRIDSLLALVQGKMPSEILKEFCSQSQGLFPSPCDITMHCSCPDSAGLCKHLAAVLYGIGARLDEEPKLFFILRGLDERELLGDKAIDSLTAGAASEIAAGDLADVFGVDFDTLEDVQPADAAAKVTQVAPQKPSATEASSRPLHPPATVASPAWTPAAIRELRIRLLMTQKQLASHLGTSTTTISFLENGKAKITPSLTKQLDTLAGKSTASPVESANSKTATVASPAWTPTAIRELRSRLQITQRQLANYLETSATTISFLENGKAKITSPLVMLLDALAKTPAAAPITDTKSKAAEALFKNWQATTPQKALDDEAPRAKRGKSTAKWTPAAIARLRKRLGLSLSDFAKLAEVSITTVRNWEHGKNQPTLTAKSRLSALEP